MLIRRLSGGCTTDAKTLKVI